MDFMDILLEAKGSKSKSIKIDTKKVQKDTTDYTDEEDPADTGDDETAADDTTAADDNTDDAGDDGSADYTQEEVDVDPQETGAEDTGGDDATDDGSDYTDVGDDPGADDGTGGDDFGSNDSGDGSDDGSDYTDGADDDTGDGSTDGSTDDMSTDETQQPDQSEAENLRILMDDYIKLFYLTKNSIIKLSAVNNSNILVNKIINQIVSNLNVLKKQLFDFIIFSFSKGKYVTNLYKYNLFLEAFKVNVQMLEKIGVFIPN